MKLTSLLFIFLSTIGFSNISAADKLPTESMQKNVQQLTSKEDVPEVNINTASVEELASKLSGIGINKAKKIIEYRDQFGPFVSIEQLKEVPGIGQATLDKNSGKIAL